MRRPIPIHKRVGRSLGFTLLEAIVALVLIGGAGMALFSWINSSIVSLRRVEDANARNEAASNIIEYMQAVNPMLTPDGKADFGAYQIQWNSVSVVDPVDGVDNPQGLSQFQLGLYQTRVGATRSDDPSWFELKLTLVGFKKVRNTQGAFK